MRVGAIWGFLAVSMGAFVRMGSRSGSRCSVSRPGGLTAERLEANFHTAAQYHMYCALALLAVGIMAETGRGSTALQTAGLVVPVGLTRLLRKPLHPGRDRI